MARSKRKLQGVTTQDYGASYWKAAIADANAAALLLDMELSFNNSRRLGLRLVRFNRMRYEHAELLIKLLREEMAKYQGKTP